MAVARKVVKHTLQLHMGHARRKRFNFGSVYLTQSALRSDYDPTENNQDHDKSHDNQNCLSDVSCSTFGTGGADRADNISAFGAVHEIGSFTSATHRPVFSSQAIS